MRAFSPKIADRKEYDQICTEFGFTGEEMLSQVPLTNIDQFTLRCTLFNKRYEKLGIICWNEKKKKKPATDLRMRRLPV